MLLRHRLRQVQRAGTGALAGIMAEVTACVRKRSLSCLLGVRCAGFLPFSAIYIELHYIFSSIWGHKVRGPGTEGLGCTWPPLGLSFYAVTATCDASVF